MLIDKEEEEPVFQVLVHDASETPRLSDELNDCDVMLDLIWFNVGVSHKMPLYQVHKWGLQTSCEATPPGLIHEAYTLEVAFEHKYRDLESIVLVGLFTVHLNEVLLHLVPDGLVRRGVFNEVWLETQVVEIVTES